MQQSRLQTMGISRASVSSHFLNFHISVRLLSRRSQQIREVDKATRLPASYPSRFEPAPTNLEAEFRYPATPYAFPVSG
jgi:hypothetical protein